MRKILMRALAILPAVFLQVIWLVILVKWLTPWATFINLGLSVLAVLFVLYLITKQGEDTYKILWLLVILSLPVPGAVLYLMFGRKRTTRSLRVKLDKARARLADLLPPLRPARLPAREGVRLGQTLEYIEKISDSALCPNQGAAFYPVGEALYPPLLEELEKAQRFIFLEYFILERGQFWDSVAQILCRKAAQGVDVRVMYDDLGSLSTYTALEALQLQQRGVRMLAFNPLLFVRGTLNFRDHRKMTIIDGRVAFSGGINLADEYINRVEKYGHWKDFGLRVEGPAVHGYLRMFAELWDAFSPDPIPAELLEPVPVPETPADGWVLVYGDSPLRDRAASNELYIELLSQAEKYAWFFTPYLMLGDSLLEAFVRAAARGVDVRIILPGIPDKKVVFRMSRSFYPVLLKAGVKLYEYTPGFVHAKGWVIDDRICGVGTVNLDYRSLFLHFENNAVFIDSSMVQKVKEDFEATQPLCRSMKWGENVPMGFFHWLLDGVLRIFSPLC